MSALEEMAVKFIQKILPPETFVKLDEFLASSMRTLNEMRAQQTAMANDVAEIKADTQLIKMAVIRIDPAETIMHAALLSQQTESELNGHDSNAG